MSIYHLPITSISPDTSSLRPLRVPKLTLLRLSSSARLVRPQIRETNLHPSSRSRGAKANVRAQRWNYALRSHAEGVQAAGGGDEGVRPSSPFLFPSPRDFFDFESCFSSRS